MKTNNNNHLEINHQNANLTERMSSLEIAELCGKQHCDVMRAIRKMEPAWTEVNGSNFALVEYRGRKGDLHRPLILTDKLFFFRFKNCFLLYNVYLCSAKSKYHLISTNYSCNEQTNRKDSGAD